jgi:hypothetical protein
MFYYLSFSSSRNLLEESRKTNWQCVIFISFCATQKGPYLIIPILIAIIKKLER